MQKKKSMKVRKISIAGKLTMLISVICIGSTAILALATYGRVSNDMIEQAKSNGKDIAACAAADIDGDVFGQIAEGMEESEEYATVLDKLAVFRDNSNIEYIYTMKQLEDGSVVFVVDADTEEPADLYEPYEMLEEMEAAFNGATTADSEITTDEWGSYFSAYSPIYDSTGSVVGIVGVDISVDWINSQLAKVSQTFIFIGIIVVLLGVICATLISQRLSRNLKKLNKKVVDLKDGDGDFTKEIEMKSGDELEVIADNMNQFLEQIRDLLKRVSAISDSVFESGSNMLATVATNKNEMGGINETVTNLSANMEECSASSETISNHLAGTAKEIGSLAERTEDIKEYTQTMKKQANEAIEEAKNNRAGAMEKIDAIYEKMQEVMERAQQIDKVNEMANQIKGIAGQTSILSLNARIEAARAGESGQGFAVVAGNIGELSQDIATSIESINSINASVISAVEELLTSSNELSTFIKTDVLHDYDSFVNIGEQYGGSASEINSKMCDLTEETERIKDTIFQISDSIEEMSKTVLDSTKRLSELNISSDAVAESMHALNVAAEDNRHNAEELSGSISQYQY